MKKIMLIILGLMISSIVVGEDGHSEFKGLSTYQNNQTAENFIKAYQHYQKQLDGESQNTARLMISYLNKIELDKNLNSLEENIDSLSFKTQFSYANLLLEVGELDKCIQIYTKLNEDFPNWSCPWRHKGEAYLKQRKLHKAEISTKKAISTRKDHYDAYIQLAEIQKELGNYKKAMRTLEEGEKYAETDYEDEVPESSVDTLRDELKELIKKHN